MRTAPVIASALRGLVLGLTVSLGWLWTAHPAAHAAPEVDREVFAYLPEWEIGYDFPHWELLTTVAFFAVGMDEFGQVSDYITDFGLGDVRT